jgi:hypothetical protein|nr:MAG TPA: Putative endo-beta-N-acetylglucosaminidase surface protein [Caudoviricetes sp.]
MSLVFNMVGGGGDVRLVSIAVTTPPAKTVYEYGDSFQSAGMVVTATYSDGASAAVTNYSISPTTFSSVGSQSVTISYTEHGITKTSTTAVTVNKKTISAVPSQSGALTYNGSSQSPTWSGYSATQLTIGGTTSGTNAGSYTATFTPKANYRWPDGTTTAKNVTWTIGKASGSLSISPTTLTLDSSTTSASIAVTRTGDGVISAVSSAPSIATASVSGSTVTVTGKASGSATITVSVAEGTNHTAPASKTCAVTANFLNSNFASNTWEQIIAACQGGSVPDTWVAGDSKAMTIDGADYPVDIIGKNHDTYAAGGTAPLTFQLHDCLNTTYVWRATWDDLITKLPESIQSAIKPVSKTINNESVSPKLFGLTENEAFGAKVYAQYAEGTQYAYYAAGNSKIKKRNGGAYGWWLSSALAQQGLTFHIFVTQKGATDSSFTANEFKGVAFAFCF